jgi:predicted Rdx family selenoprotein
MSDVIQLGEYKFKRKREGFVPAARAGCQHKNMTIEDWGDVITCDDCGKQLGAAWVLREVLADYSRELDKVNARAAQVQEQTSREIHLIAARKVEAAWRSKTMAPACPHCGRGILAGDGLGSSLVNRSMEVRRRGVETASKPK